MNSQPLAPRDLAVLGCLSGAIKAATANGNVLWHQDGADLVGVPFGIAGLSANVRYRIRVGDSGILFTASQTGTAHVEKTSIAPHDFAPLVELIDAARAALTPAPAAGVSP